MNRSITLVTLLFLAGCATSIERKSEFVNARIDPSQSAYVALPADGGFDGRVIARSGEKTQAVVTHILSAYLRNVTNGDEVETTDQALATAQARGGNFVFVPRILHWEDHRTEYSGRRDHVEVEFKVFDAASGKLVSATTVKGTSTFWSSGGDQPEDLLVEPVGVFVLKLLGYVPADYK